MREDSFALRGLITLAENERCREVGRQSAENHRSCSDMFAMSKYPASPWRVVMS